MAKGTFPAVPMRSKWTPSTHFWSIASIHVSFAPTKSEGQAAPCSPISSLWGQSQPVANHSLSAFRFLGVSDTRPLCLQAPGHIGKILQVVPFKAPFLGLMWGETASQHTDSTPKSALLECHYFPLTRSSLFIRMVVGYQLRVTKPVSDRVSPSLVGLHLFWSVGQGAWFGGLATTETEIILCCTPVMVGFILFHSLYCVVPPTVCSTQERGEK